MTGAGTGAGMSWLLARIFLSCAAVIVGVGAQCSKQDYQYCVKLADPLLKDPHLIYPDNARDIERVCRTWSFFVDCIKQYTDRCFTEIKRQEFNKAVENPVNSIHKLCSMPDYRDDYMKHAPCMKMTLTQDSHCGRHYRHLVAQVSGEAPRASICCSHHLFRECVLDHTRNSCQADAAPFSAQMLDKALSFLKDQCNNFIPNRVDCPGSDFYQSGRADMSTVDGGEMPQPSSSATSSTRMFGTSTTAGGNMGGPHMGGPPMRGPPMEDRPMRGPPMEGPPMGGPPMRGPPMEGPPMRGPPMESQPMDSPHMGGSSMGGTSMGGTTMGGGSGGGSSVTVQMNPPSRTSPQPSWMSSTSDTRGVPTGNTPDWRHQENTASSPGWLPNRGRSSESPTSETVVSSSEVTRVTFGRGITWPATDQNEATGATSHPPTSSSSTPWFPSSHSRPHDSMHENAIDEPNQQGLGSADDNSKSPPRLVLSLVLMVVSLFVQSLLSR